MGQARQAFGVSGIREVERGRLWGFLAVLHAEFRRARAAAQRYRDLRYRSACYEGIALAHLPPRIFEEFYRDSEDAAVLRPETQRSALHPDTPTCGDGERVISRRRPSPAS
jgi:hypothetical protein